VGGEFRCVSRQVALLKRVPRTVIAVQQSGSCDPSPARGRVSGSCRQILLCPQTLLNFAQHYWVAQSQTCETGAAQKQQHEKHVG
jgi:hypothetical protein